LGRSEEILEYEKSLLIRLKGEIQDMNKDMMQDKLKQLREELKQRWGALTDKDLDTVDMNLVKLPGLLQARYRYTKEQAEKEIALFLSNMKPESDNPVEVVLETLSGSSPEEEAHVAKRADKE
jgi:uncharacterized protein YjbJ (UPF0337 family)